MIDLFTQCLGWALIAGALGTSLCTIPLSWSEMGRQSALIFNDYKWLPTFLMSGHLAFHVQRWRQFIFAAWSVEGRIKDLGITIGSDVRNPGDIAARRLMFKIYRFLVLAMALQYKSIFPPLKDWGPDLPRNLQRLGLLTAQEALVLAPAGTRMRDTVLSWVAREVNCNGPCGTGLLLGQTTLVTMEKLTALRANMMYFHGNNFYPEPNLVASFTKLLVDIFCCLVVYSFPFKLHCPRFIFQAPTVLGVFLLTLSFWGTEGLVSVLAKPFATKIDTFNIDHLIAGTEQTLFASMRGSFDDVARESKMGG